MGVDGNKFYDLVSGWTEWRVEKNTILEINFSF